MQLCNTFFQVDLHFCCANTLTKPQPKDLSWNIMNDPTKNLDIDKKLISFCRKNNNNRIERVSPMKIDIFNPLPIFESCHLLPTTRREEWKILCGFLINQIHIKNGFLSFLLRSSELMFDFAGKSYNV